MRMLGRAALAALLLTLSGCGWLMGDEGIFRDRSDEYRKAQLEPALRIPPGLNGEVIDDAYPIPGISESVSLSEDFVVPRPDPLEGDPSAQMVKIQRLGSDQWILVEATPGQVWPQVRGFLNQAQLSTDRVDPGMGIIETSWLEPQDGNLRSERYRFRIEQGVQRGTSEVYILHDLIGGDAWPEASESSERESAMIQELAQFVANNSAEGVVSMVAERALDSRGKVFLQRDEDRQPYLDLQLPFVRAWGALGLALEKAGLEVEDLNRSERRYWVRAQPEVDPDECGWFSRLFGCGEIDPADIRSYVLEMQPAEEQSVTLRIRSADDRPLSPQDAERLLNRVKGFIS